MGDLIDLNSPDQRKLLTSKLASPLIPGPETPMNGEAKKEHNISFVSHGKRSSLDNNPFDKVFKETAEYVAKKEDPFEVVLEKAMQSENHNSRKQPRYVEPTQDSTPKRRRHSEVLKMNKTLDEPLLREIMNKNLSRLAKQSWRLNEDKSVIKNLNNMDSLKGNMTEFQRASEGRNDCPSPNIVIFPPSPQDSSLLNQSAMNDTLSEVGGSLTKSEVGETNADAVHVDLDCLFIKPSKHRRSLSQGNKKSPESPRREEVSFRPRSWSTVDNSKIADLLRKSRLSSTSGASQGQPEYGNNAFIETGCSSNTESLDFSKISGPPRVNLGSLGSVSSLYSYGSMNKALILNSQSSGQILGSSSSVRSSLSSATVSRAADVENCSISMPLKTPVNISDLEHRFAQLKMQSTVKIQGLPYYSPHSKVESFLQQDGFGIRNTNEDNEQGLEREKGTTLIDTDVFVPPQENDECRNRTMDSTSNCSSDSVFLDNNKIDQSVFREAKMLARTFDELAQQSASSSLSNPDDLLPSYPCWNFDILPVSDDDDNAMVDDLIELPTSPARGNGNIQLSPNESITEIQSSKIADPKACENVKQLETEFIDQDIARNKVMATTLLMDLEKIVHKENNAEAIMLLENLEKVLGVKYESNAQLLATCMQGTNNLSKSPKKCATGLGSNENIKRESLEKSHDDNDIDQVSNGARILEICDDVTLGMNLNIEKAINKSEKYIMPDFSTAVNKNEGNFSEKSNSHSIIAENLEKETFIDQTEALELITNLSKILGGRNNDSSPLSLLSNLRQVLNLATNQLHFENSQIKKLTNNNMLTKAKIGDDVSQNELVTSPKVEEKKAIITSKSVRKKSIDSAIKEKNIAPVLIKRSMSLSSAQGNTAPIAALAKEKSRQHSKTFKKALSCEAVPKAGTLDKLSSVRKEVDKGRVSAVNGTGKYKLKKKTEVESIISKKGPLKALVPVGNMQRRGSLSMKVAPMLGPKTPPKSGSNVPCAFTAASSSTPNPIVALNFSKKSPKSKPVASSTPDGGGSRVCKTRLQISKNMPKPKFSCNISPVTPMPAHSFTGSTGFGGDSPKSNRHNRTLSPPKRQEPQEVRAHNSTVSSIPKYSPLAGFSRKNSRETIKSLENSGSPKLSAKSQTPKKKPFVHSKSESQIPHSPLKTMNNQNAKYKPFNLISKLRRGSSGSNVADKENCA